MSRNKNEYRNKINKFKFIETLKIIYKILSSIETLKFIYKFTAEFFKDLV